MKRNKSTNKKNGKQTQRPEKSENIVKLNADNLKQVKRIAKHFSCSNDDAVNIMLGSANFVLTNTPKTQITVNK